MAVLIYKCPYCGGELLFDAETQNFTCEYCVSSFSQSEVEAMNPDKKEEEILKNDDMDTGKDNTKKKEENINGGNSWEDIVYYSCPSCGAEITTEATTAATFCYYCHSPVILQGRLSGEYMPDSILPFAIDKEDAKNKFLEFIKKKRYVPVDFFDERQLDCLSGVYFPYWIYSCQTEGEFQAEGEKTRTWRSGDTRYTEHNVYRINRMGNLAFKDIYKNALKKSNKALAEGIFSYDMESCRDFHISLLSGYLAEKRDISSEELEQEVKNDVSEYTKELLEDTLNGFTSVTSKKSNSHVKEEEWEYVLFPVWTITYPGSDDINYFYSMNGQTGSVIGKLPIDKKKLVFGAVKIGIIALILLLTGGMFIW